MNDWAGGYLGPGLGLTQISVAKNFLLICIISSHFQTWNM